MNNFLLDLLSFAAVLSGILVITSTNPVISVLFLISVFINAAGYLLLLGVGFVGISYLIVYVGAHPIPFRGYDAEHSACRDRFCWTRIY
jgi:NADH-ubiquinone oxidoreductase chain 6